METIIIQAREQDSNSTRNGEFVSLLKKPITIMAGDEVVVNNAFIDTRNQTTDRIVIEEDIVIKCSANIYTYNNEFLVRRQYTDELVNGVPLLNDDKRWAGVWTTGGQLAHPNIKFVKSIKIPILSNVSSTEEINIQFQYFSWSPTQQLTVDGVHITPKYPYIPHYCCLKAPATQGAKEVILSLSDKLIGNKHFSSPSTPPEDLITGIYINTNVPGYNDIRPLEKLRYLEAGFDIDNIQLNEVEEWNDGSSQAEPSDNPLYGSFALLEPNFSFIIPAKSYSPNELADFISSQMGQVGRTPSKGVENSVQAPNENTPATTGPAPPFSKTDGGPIAPNIISNYVDGTVNYYDDTNWSGRPFLTMDNLLDQKKLPFQQNIGELWDSSNDVLYGPNAPIDYEVGFAGDNKGFKFQGIAVPWDYDTETNTQPADKGSFSSTARLIGASQIALEYDNGFKWTFLHTPQYFNDNITATYNNSLQWQLPKENQPAPTPGGWLNKQGLRGAGTDVRFYWLSSQGGIAWTSLEPASFWEDTLGFDLHSLLFSPRYRNETQSRTVIATPPPTGTSAFGQNGVFDGEAGAGEFLAYFPLNYGGPGNPPLPATTFHLWTTPISNTGSIIDGDDSGGYSKFGVNLTTGELESDVAVNKNYPDNFSGFEVIANDGGAVPTDYTISIAPNPCVTVAIENATIPITASTNFDGSLTSGYFLLEMNAKMINNFTGNSFNSNLIMGVLSRYYSLGNYTSTSYNDLSYIHRGEPIILTEIGVRILQPNGKLADIGDDNTIFIKVIKQPTGVPPTKEKIKTKGEQSRR